MNDVRQEEKRHEDLLPLMQRAFDLCLSLYGHVNRFPRAYKPLLGRDILSASQQMLIRLITATRRHERLAVLREADLHLETVRILVRLAHRLTFLSHKGYEVISKELTEIGRMLGGWIKAQPNSPHLSPLPQGERGGTEATQTSPPLMGGDGGEGDKIAKKPLSRQPAVRYTMQSPKVEEYLKAKLAHPHDIVLVKTGAFYKTFFEDALYLNQTLRLKIQNLSAKSESERIISCGFPVVALEKFQARLASLGRALYVSE